MKSSIVTLIFGVLIFSVFPFIILLFPPRISTLLLIAAGSLFLVFLFSFVFAYFHSFHSQVDTTILGAFFSFVLYLVNVIGSVFLFFIPKYHFILRKLELQLPSKMTISSPLSPNSLITSLFIFLMIGSFSGWLIKFFRSKN